MEALLRSLVSLKKSPVASLVGQRMKEFKAKRAQSEDEVFSELCFCLLTANYSAERAMVIQNEIGDGFIILPRLRLAKKLKQLGYRFPNARARYIVEARKHRSKIRSTLTSAPNDAERREWLVENVLGLGYKEASHFLRNIGYSDVAIIDFHIVDLLASRKIIKKPKNKSLPHKRYLEIERVLASLAERANLSQGELDLYLWYMETGKVLK